MKTSVIIATYNGSKFIEEQLDSILAQSVQPDEVVITDDGSKDNTKEIVQRYIDKHGLNEIWHLYVNEKNKGYAKNFLDGTTLTTGDIIFFCDQDDIWTLDRVKRMSEVMENNPGINLLCSNYELFYYEKNTYRCSKKNLSVMKTDNSLEYCKLTPEYFHLRRLGCTMCIRKNFLSEIMPYWTANWAHDDFVWKMAMFSSSCAIFHYISLKRRMHYNNVSAIRVRTREGRINQLHEYELQYASLKKYAKELVLSEEKQKLIERNMDSVRIRLNVVEKRHLLNWINLFFNYAECYPRVKGLYLDLYLSVLNKYKGVN